MPFAWTLQVRLAQLERLERPPPACSLVPQASSPASVLAPTRLPVFVQKALTLHAPGAPLSKQRATPNE